MFQNVACPIEAVEVLRPERPASRISMASAT